MNKFHRFKIVSIGIIFLVPFVMGVVKLFLHDHNYEPSVNYHAEIVDAPNGLSINGTFIKGKGYQANIKIDTSTLVDKYLPEHLDEVKSGENIVQEYNYNLNSDQLSASLLIMEKDVRGDIKVKLTLVDHPLPPVVKANITLNPGEGHFVSGKSTIELSLIEEHYLSDFTNYEEPIPTGEEYEFKYWLNGEERITSITSIENLTGNVTLTAFYDVKCIHEYHYEIVNRQLYSVCSKCGKTIRYTNQELATFAKKMLVMEDGGLVLYDISELPYIVNRFMAADVYLIYGEYDLSGNRDGAQVQIRIHGLNNNEGEMNATILNYAVGDDGNYYYVPLHGIKFTIDNVIMKSSFNYSDGFYFGLYSDSLICNNCRFIGKHSLYADYVEINDSTLDTTMVTSGNLTDYAMYVYGSHDATFNRCTFNTLGKAIKIYNEGYTGSHVTANNCVFNVIEPRLSDKAAVEIDSTYLGEKIFVVKIHQCTNNGHNQMWFDKSDHHDVTVD